VHVVVFFEDITRDRQLLSFVPRVEMNFVRVMGSSFPVIMSSVSDPVLPVVFSSVFFEGVE